MSRINRIVHALPHAFTNALYMAYRGKHSYFQDGLLTVHDGGFRQDLKFMEAYALMKATSPNDKWGKMWRAHVCCWAAMKGRDIPGDFVECGVNLGGLSRAVAHYVDLDRLDKKLWLLDTFDGLVERQITPAERQTGVKLGQYVECYDQARENFKDVRNARFVRGAVPGTLPQVDAERVCYLSIDMNVVEPEIAAAEFFWDRLSSGAAIVLDDYGWARHAEQQKAFNVFAQKRGVPILGLPTGQGIIMKPLKPRRASARSAGP
jgi:hypothetical protein